MIGNARNPICEDARECFGKMQYRGRTVCRILTDSYEPGKCPFCKKDKDECLSVTSERKGS